MIFQVNSRKLNANLNKFSSCITTGHIEANVHFDSRLTVSHFYYWYLNNQQIQTIRCWVTVLYLVFSTDVNNF